MPNKYKAIETFGYKIIDQDGRVIAVVDGIASEWVCAKEMDQAVEKLENKTENKENTQ
jgi:hypothetical protein